VGTNLKFYIELGGGYNDITPIRDAVVLTDPFETTAGSAIVTVTDINLGYVDSDFVTYSGATSVGGLDLNGEYQLTYITGSTYTITASSVAGSSVTGGGTVTATYQINVGSPYAVPYEGWGAGFWSGGPWGVGDTSSYPLRLWSQANFGEDLIFGPRGGGIYYWDVSAGFGVRGELIADMVGAVSVPTIQNNILISDASRFVFAIGANEVGSGVQNPMCVRWSDQENYLDWFPAATNQAGSLVLSTGSELITSMQSRQEILVWSDTALYSFQYVEPPIVWGSQLVGNNISIASPNAAAYANGITYWMGKDKFYVYNGRVQPLPCDVRRFVFSNINTAQWDQVFTGTNEGFNEVWWFYCSEESTTIDRYVIYNYVQEIWYYGSMGRTAWIDTGEKQSPLAATYNNKIVRHEVGCDDAETSSPVPISSYILSTQFDIADGNRFSFIWRILPDLNFDGSTNTAPLVTMSLLPLNNSGSGYNDPTSIGGSSAGNVVRTSVVPIDQYTEQVNVRVRGRQLAMKFESVDEGVKWQLGSPRIDIRPDGGR
tara:strand:+ start:3250 stop:4878 length:1629 start_codon:yes stop_codon:yes gene_type:complete